MNSFIKKIVKPFVSDAVLQDWQKETEKKQYDEWVKNGCPVPPPHIAKQITIAEYQQKYGYNILVETGTFMGDMVQAQKERFKKIISIELSEQLFEKAKARFRDDAGITIVQGDSGKVLPAILKDIDEPVLFWLDGHYSAGATAKGDKECPIYEEIDAIFSAKKLDHAILIDDARLFIGEGDYPAIDALTEYVKSKNENYQVEVKHDVIRYVI